MSTIRRVLRQITKTRQEDERRGENLFDLGSEDGATVATAEPGEFVSGLMP